MLKTTKSKNVKKNPIISNRKSFDELIYYLYWLWTASQIYHCRIRLTPRMLNVRLL